jgi:hypothetical protein
MDDINADLEPDSETGDPSVESGRLRPITRLLPGLVRRSNARWPVGLVLAMIVVLAASGLAFGAQVVPVFQSGNPATHQMVSQPLSATPVVVLEGSDDPTALPTLAPELPLGSTPDSRTSETQTTG